MSFRETFAFIFQETLFSFSFSQGGEDLILEPKVIFARDCSALHIECVHVCVHVCVCVCRGGGSAQEAVTRAMSPKGKCMRFSVSHRA